MTKMPVALTDSQKNAVLNAIKPLRPAERGAFLSAFALMFQDRGEIGTEN
jgi:hypothetical protein